MTDINPYTPLPWEYDNLELQDRLSGTSCVYAEGYPLVALNIGHGCYQNAKYMAMACNEYPKLKEQNKKLIEALRGLLSQNPQMEGWADNAESLLNSIKEQSND